ncbi:MAG TPA: hypothetical protein VH540_17510 [Ktedonobacterales bacterium]
MHHPSLCFRDAAFTDMLCFNKGERGTTASILPEKHNPRAI